ncbi:hypothetical protein NON20_08970 [Synechocystis sp. B12]|nr:hypothetical protein NON20_08970 [Synechocystis sp. B12]
MSKLYLGLMAIAVIFSSSGGPGFGKDPKVFSAGDRPNLALT